MSHQIQTSLTQKLQELNELYYTAPLAIYESALQSAINQLEQALPGFTISFAEIYTMGSERQVHSGMRHVLMPTERSQ